ncbi:hypothetical protein EAH89_21350 [Roseomonas nepalensis]|uniref:Uncharacterized protein n=1 Tax=Muricoccus nepalensis TaxID=1854500 RepID=A0A502FJB4_9PROT|nr:hypothetical protein [Roseomonas nepalensis]TPG49558.1 hypothetical protein EAH89_21350 [Roseomonas nepalensis]
MREQSTPTPKGGALLPACRLYRKASAKGAPYLMGRLGGLRVLILPKRDGEEGEHTHNLLLAEATQRDQKDGAR